MSHSGSFAQLTAPEILRNVKSSAATGRLKLISGPWRRVLYFERGRLVYATSSHPEESFGEVLVRAGKITPAQLRDALAAAPSSRKVGATLVERGLLPPSDLVWGTQQQVREIILAAFAIAEGSWSFEEGDLATEDIVRLNIPFDAIVREGIRRIHDPRLLLRPLGSMDARLEPRPQAAFPLDEREKGLLDTIRRGPRSVRELCRESGLPAIDACRALVTLVAAGAARRAEA